MKLLAIIFTTIAYLFLHSPTHTSHKNVSAKAHAVKTAQNQQLSEKQLGVIHNLTFIDNVGKTHRLLDSTKKVNMLVFWASWCSPCRMEIPNLKEIYGKTDSAKVRLISISVDKDKAAWIKAMKEEKMPWPQLLAEGDNLKSIKADFGFTGIPQIYFVDNKGNVLDSYTGYHYDNNVGLTALVKRMSEK